MKNPFPTSRLGIALLLGMAATSAAAQSVLGSYGEAILASGENAPGLPGITLLSNGTLGFDTPVIDQNGYIVCRARLAGAVTTLDDRAIFAGFGAGDMNLVVRAGDQAPGLPAGILLRSNTSSASGPGSTIQVSPENQILYFQSALSDNSVTVTALNDSALFWGPASALNLLAREGDPVPFLTATGELWGPLSFSRQNNTINKNGRVVFTTTVTGGASTTANDLIMVSGDTSSLEKVVREGDDLDGMGGTLVGQNSTTASFSAQINDLGQILLDIKLGGTATTSNDSVLAVFTPGGSVQFIAREGDQAPGLPNGIVMTGSFGRGSSSWDNSGALGFTSVLSDGGATVTTANDNCLFYGGVGTATKVAREGEPTGIPTGELFGVFNSSSVSTNVHGTMAFFASMTDAAGAALPTTADSAMFYGTAGNFTAVVREGDVIAAIPASVNGPWTCGAVTSATYLNGHDQLMFTQSASDTVDTVTFWLCYDPVLGLHVIRDATETYNTALGLATATASTSFGGSQSNGGGCPNFFNNAGDFVLLQGLSGAAPAALVRGHCGILQGTPSAISNAAGGTHSFGIHAGPANAFNFYAIVGGMSGTSPGTLLPLGPQVIPLNFDAYTSLSIALFNTVIYPNSLWFTDANGDAAAPASFFLPPMAGLPSGVLHHVVVGLSTSFSETFVSEPRALHLY